MAFWTIIGEGVGGDAEGKAFGVTLDTDQKQWTASGPSISLFFSSRSGRFAVVGIPENGTQLVNAAGGERAFFRALNGASAVGATGTGRASGMGRNFSWKLDSK